MPKKRRAGQNIRNLALKRRGKAVSFFASAGLMILFPFVLTKTFQNVMKSIMSQNPAPSQTLISQNPIFYTVFILLALGLVANGVFYWQRANHADQGARGEEDTAQEMLQLEQEGWQIEYGVRFGKKLADIDIFCMSPQNKAYVIDVKSHKGQVTSDGELLYRQVGKTTYPFEKDFLVQVMKEALQLKKYKNLSFVTPIIAFSNAKVLVLPSKIKHVYVVEKSKLITLLRSLG